METPEQKKFTSTKKGEIFELLSNHRRRYTIEFCKRNGSTSLSELAEHIAALEQEKSISEITSAERKRVYTSLQQTHLDRLEQANMIQYDGQRIELTDRAQEVEVYLDIVPEGSVSWGHYYFGLSVLAALVVAAVLTEFVPPSLVDESVALVLLTLVYGLSAAAHIIYNRRYRLAGIEDSQ